MENKLAVIIAESHLDKTKAEILLTNFQNYFEIAAEWERKIDTLCESEVPTVPEMRMAAEGRKFLKGKRVDVENTRKTLKEASLREGQTIDSIAKILKNLIEPIEEKAETIEKYDERIEAKRKAALKVERTALLSVYEIETGFYDLENMPEESFQVLLASNKKAYEDKKEAERKAEEDRIAKEKAEEEERKRIVAENERLKLESERKEKELAIERAKVEKERKEAEEKSRIEREKIELAAKIERERQEEISRKQREESERILLAERKAATAKLEKEQTEARRLASELKAKQDSEEKAEKERLEKELAEKKKQELLAKAPRKEKLNKWVDEFIWISPVGMEQDQIILLINEKFGSFKKWAKQQIELS